MATPHISAEAGDFAEVCLLPGDPLRARYVAERFLDNAVLVTAVRNMEGYTGTYRGRRMSVMGTGMGLPSLLIYVTELIRDYGVSTLVRIGSCGGLQPEMSLCDIVIASGASTDSNTNRVRFGGFDFAAVADFALTRSLVEAVEAKGLTFWVGNILSSDNFYHPQPEFHALCQRMGLLAVEMEAAGLYAVAAENGARAATVLTVSDVLDTRAGTVVALMTPQQRETSLDEMVAVALDAATQTRQPTDAPHTAE